MSAELTGIDSPRPALVKLTSDIYDERRRFMSGYESRRNIIEFAQWLTIRTLGEIPDRFYKELANEFQVNDSAHESTFIAALLSSDARTRKLSEEAVNDLRNDLWSMVIYPAYHRSLRKLRKNAGEYIGNQETGPGDHAATLQRSVAMRPALDWIDSIQKQVLADCLDGFDDREEINVWASQLELATHGEIHDHFAPRCLNELSTVLILTTDNQTARRARELFAATYLLPYFNKGIRDLAGRAGEHPDAVSQDDGDLPRWD